SRVGLLRPASAAVPLPGRGATRRLESIVIPPEAGFEKDAAPPEGEVGAVPPVHLQIELARPGVVGQPGLLGRGRPAPFTAVRYCDSTTRRSNSSARSSSLPSKVTATPLCQYPSHQSAAASTTSANVRSIAAASGSAGC